MLVYGQVIRQTGLTYGAVIRITVGPTYGQVIDKTTDPTYGQERTQ